jgi:pimeloyl-ACP methyl ester carboxylesterase
MPAMSPSSRSVAALLLILVMPLARPAQGATPASPAADLRNLLRYEPTGISLLRPYARGKVPVLFVHGLWLHPWSWNRMIEVLEADPVISQQFQFWTFGYSTGDPIPYSAYLLRRNLDEVRRQLDRMQSDPALDRMVVVGHSMGGLLSRMMASESGDRLWHVVSDRPFTELAGERGDIELFRNGLFFKARPEVRRVVYIATPHRGSRIDRGSLQRVGMRLVRFPDPLRASHDRLVASNAPTFFREYFRKTMPSSIDELEWGSPILTGLSALAHAPTVKAHSIIAVRPESPPDRRTDGLVTYDSAHLDGTASEKVVSTGHLCQDHPEVIAEIRRILLEHAAQ